jgi:WD40 repeat protein
VGHSSVVADLGFTSDDAYLVSVSQDGTIRLWDPDVEAGESFSRRMSRSIGGVTAAYRFNRLAIAPMAALPASGSSDGTRVATLGGELEEDDTTSETLTLWDVAARSRADELKQLPRQNPGVKRLPQMLRLARELQVKPRIMKDPLPGCR